MKAYLRNFSSIPKHIVILLLFHSSFFFFVYINESVPNKDVIMEASFLYFIHNSMFTFKFKNPLTKVEIYANV